MFRFKSMGRIFAWFPSSPRMHFCHVPHHVQTMTLHALMEQRTALALPETSGRCIYFEPREFYRSIFARIFAYCKGKMQPCIAGILHYGVVCW